MLQSFISQMFLPKPAMDAAAAPNMQTGAANALIDAADEKFAMVVQIPKTGNIRKVWWATGTVTTGATVDVRVETVNTTDGFPSGTLKATNSNASQIVADTDDDAVFGTQLTADCPVTIGDMIAVVIVNPSVSPGNMIIANFQDDSDPQFPYCLLFTTAWSKRSGLAPLMALEYSDGSFVQLMGVAPHKPIWNTHTYNSGSAVNKRALKFKLPFPCKVNGAWVWGDMDGDYKVVLYDSDGITVKAESATMYAFQRSANSGGTQLVRFTSDAELAKDTFYYLALVPQTTTNLSLYSYDLITSTAADAHELGADAYYSEYNGSSWSDTITRRPFIGIKVSALDDGASAGSPFQTPPTPVIRPQ